LEVIFLATVQIKMSLQESGFPNIEPVKAYRIKELP